MEDTPVRSAYLEALAGAQEGRGAFVRAEAGVHPWGPLGAFVFAQEDTQVGWSTGAGVRAEWKW